MSTSTQVTTQRDVEFFQAVYALMQNSFPDMIEKFGIWRIHEHFAISKDETLHETSNENTKESILRIIKKSDLPTESFATCWKLSDQGHIVAAWCCDGPVNPKP